MNSPPGITDVRVAPPAGEMARLIDAYDWSRTKLGPIEGWPQTLRTASEILIHSGFPMYIAWGADFVQLYNDAFRPILGATKHSALGKRAVETFAESWSLIGPVFRAVMDRGIARTFTDQLLPLNRKGTIEECYFTLSCSAIRNIGGGVGGVFVTIFDTTEKIVGQRRLQALDERQRESDAFLEIALKSAGLGVWHGELGTAEVNFDSTLAAMFGLAPEPTLLQDEQWQNLIHPEDRGRALAELAARRADHRALEVEFRIVRRDGTMRWIAVQGTVVRHGTSGARSVGVARDVTESKRASERQQLLLHELNHRVRNSLATVLALAQQTAAGAVSTQHFIRAFQSRVLALAEAHNLLTRKDWAGISLRDLIEVTLGPDCRAKNGRIEIAGPEYELPAPQALAMSLGMHELAANARRYGALSVPTGRLRVCWACERTDGDDCLNVSWIERGGPPVLRPQQTGFGMRLLDRALARDLGGTVDLAFDPAGLRCTIDFRVSRTGP